MALAAELPQTDASSLVDRDLLEAQVKDMYRQVAREQDAELHFEVGRPLALHVGYPSGLLDAIPAEAMASFAGVGYHLDLAVLAPGRRCSISARARHRRFLCRRASRRLGRVVGVDFTDEQIAKATRLEIATGSPQVEFREASIDASRSRTGPSTWSSRTA